MLDFTKPHIYKRTIVKTGKSYIGKTLGNLKSYRGSGKAYLKDYKLFVKNRKEDLIEEILEYCDENIINEREEYWLKFYNVVENENFYNLTIKNHGVSNTPYEVKLKQRKSSPTKKKIIQYDLKGNFIEIHDSLRDGARKTTGDYKNGSSISKVVSGKNVSSHGFQWRSFEDNYPLKIDEAKVWIRPKGTKYKLNPNRVYIPGSGKHTSKKKVEQYNSNNEYIQTFDSIIEACISMSNSNKYATGISSCLKGKTKTCNGYIWKEK